MSVVEYFISDGINCLFELPVTAVKKILPVWVQPIETNPGTTLIGVTMFEFSESPVGPYQELVLSLYVVPRSGLGAWHPHAAVYPIVVASGNHMARQHAIDLWHLPHFMEDIYIDFTPGRNMKSMTGIARCHRGEPIIGLTVSESGKWRPMQQYYQSFQGDDTGAYVGILDMKGSLNEHEENTGSLVIHHEHRFFDAIDLSSLEPVPYREMWLKNGVESYHDLLTLPDSYSDRRHAGGLTIPL